MGQLKIKKHTHQRVLRQQGERESNKLLKGSFRDEKTNVWNEIHQSVKRHK